MPGARVRARGAGWCGAFDEGAEGGGTVAAWVGERGEVVLRVPAEGEVARGGGRCGGGHVLVLRRAAGVAVAVACPCVRARTC